MPQLSLPVAQSLPGSSSAQDMADLATRYREVRSCTESLCSSLTTEDFVIQSMPDASPVKWHLAHTSWFFETFVLVPGLPDYQPFHPQFGLLFNSYYNAVGERWPRPQRGLLSRPTVAEVFRYRAYVDERIAEFLDRADARTAELRATVVLGLHHEQQHQELIVTDLKNAFANNPLHPVYREAMLGSAPAVHLRWLSYPEGVYALGHAGDGFAFDNELPRHRVFLQDFQLASRPVSNGEYLDFMNDGGYQRPDLWLAEGWTTRQERGWEAPLYWHRHEGGWLQATLAGLRPVEPQEPVCHVSYYEADAFARWAGARLPAEAEWETAAADVPLSGHFLEAGRFHPAAAPAANDHGPLVRLYGDIWQWTASAYAGYPGFQPAAGALGEYNGKFMCNQLVLRGASCATPRSHARRTYRNFFPPDARWQFSGIRLARRDG